MLGTYCTLRSTPAVGGAPSKTSRQLSLNVMNGLQTTELIKRFDEASSCKTRLSHGLKFVYSRPPVGAGEAECGCSADDV